MNKINCFLDVLKELAGIKTLANKNAAQTKEKIDSLTLDVEKRFGSEGVKYFKQIVDVYKLKQEPHNGTITLSLEEKLLPLCKLAYLEEKNGHAEEHAQKLALLFNNEQGVIDYLLSFATQSAYRYFLHDACLFELPEQDEQWSYWKKMANQKNMMLNPRFLELLPSAKEINQLMDNKEKGKKTHDLLTITAMKQLVLAKNKEYKRLEQTPVAYPSNSDQAQNLKNERKLKLALLSQERSALRIELAKYCVHLSWQHIDVTILQAFYEQYSEQSNKAHKILVKHGISTKSIAEFDSLEKVNDNEAIPDVVIDGNSIGYPSYSLRRLDMTNEEDAAIAACLGKITNCCQYLGGVGGECAKHGISSPDGGFYVVYKGLEIVGQTWAWRGSGLCFDSIESAPNSDTAIIADMYRCLANVLVKNPVYKIPLVNVGTNSGISAKVGYPDYISRKIHNVDYGRYSDAHSQWVVADVAKPYLSYSKMNSPEFNKSIEKEVQALLESLLVDEKPLKEMESLKELISFALYIKNPDLLLVVKNTLASRKEELDALISQNEAFYSALDKGNIELGSVKEGAFLDMMNSQGKSALHLSIAKADETMTGQLIELGIEINTQDKWGKTPLFQLIQAKRQVEPLIYQRLVKLLIEAGADPDINDKDENTPLHLAVQQGDLEMVRYLVEQGANLDIFDAELKTAIYMAVEQGKEEIFTYLLDHNAKINIRDLNDKNNLLMITCSSGNLNMVKALLAKSEIDLGHKNKEGANVLHFALNHLEILQCLLEKMPLKQAQELIFSHKYQMSSPIQRSFDNQQAFDLFWQLISPEQKLHIAVLKGNLAQVNNLVQSGVNINARDNFGETAITLALRKKDPSENRAIAQFIINSGADLNIKDQDGTSPLIHAARHGDLMMVQNMVEKGADLETCDAQNKTALYWAAEIGNKEIVSFLISKSANIHVVDNKKSNLLMTASATGNSDLVHFLLNQKCFDLSDKNLKGEHVLHFASTLTILEILLAALPLAQALNLIFYHDKSSLSFIALRLNSNAFNMLLNVLPSGQSQTTTDPILYNHLHDLLDYAVTQKAPKIIEQLFAKISFDLTRTARDTYNLLHKSVGDRQILQLILAKLTQEQALKLMQEQNSMGLSPLYMCAQDYNRTLDSLELLLNFTPQNHRLELVKAQSYKPAYEDEQSLFDKIFLYPHFLRTLSPIELQEVVKTTFKNDNTFFHEASWHPESINMGLEVYPRELRLSMLMKANKYGTNALNRLINKPESMVKVFHALPYSDYLQFLKSTDMQGESILLNLYYHAKEISSALSLLKPKEILDVFAIKDKNKLNLIYRHDGNFLDGLKKYLSLIPVEHRFDVALNGLQDALEYYKLSHAYDRYKVLRAIIESLPANKKWAFIEAIRSHEPSFSERFIEVQFAELIALIPDKTFELLSVCHEVPLIHYIAYHHCEKLQNVLDLLSNEQCFTLLRLKSKYDMTVLANVIKEPKAAKIILKTLTREQQKRLITESHHFNKPFINGTTKDPELLQIALEAYPPEERLNLLFTSSSRSKKLIYKIAKKPEALKVVLDSLPDSQKNYFLNYRVFGYTVKELMDSETPRKDLKYTFEKDIDELIYSTIDDKRERFFKQTDTKSVRLLFVQAQKNDERRINLYHHFANLEAQDPIQALFINVLFSEETLDKETMLSRLKIRWDINLPSPPQPEQENMITAQP